MKESFKIAQAFLFLLATAGAFSQSLNGLLQTSRGNGERVSSITLNSHELFARKEVTGQGGIFEFINNTDDKAQGLINFDKARLPQNQAFLFDHVFIGFGEPSEAAGLGKAVYGSVEKHPGLANSEFEIKQGGRTVLSMPTRALSPSLSQVGTRQADNYTTLESIAYLSDLDDFTWSFKMPNGEVIDAAAGSIAGVEVRLGGWLTGKRTL